MIEATGGTITESGDFRIHTFTGPGSFAVTKISGCSADNAMDYLVVAAGGAGGDAEPVNLVVGEVPEDIENLRYSKQVLIQSHL